MGAAQIVCCSLVTGSLKVRDLLKAFYGRHYPFLLLPCLESLLKSSRAFPLSSVCTKVEGALSIAPAFPPLNPLLAQPMAASTCTS
eukprot:SAG31_NODE_567_length_14028_cov_4.022328_15_plen_86_part_00